MAADDPLLDELYGMPRDDFVRHRDRLADALRAAGDQARARAVAERQPPTRAAATLNRIARERPADLAAFLSGGAPEQLAAVLESTGKHRELIARALVAARDDAGLAAVLASGTLEWVPDPPDAVRQLARAYERERGARVEIAQARADVDRLRNALRAAERRLHDAERDAQRANAERRRLER